MEGSTTNISQISPPSAMSSGRRSSSIASELARHRAKLEAAKVREKYLQQEYEMERQKAILDRDLKMFVNTKGVIFVIYTFFVILFDSISPGTFVVSNCPKNQHEVIKASRRLQCVNDKNGNNQYLCLPMKEKTSLVEFCFDADMKIEEKDPACQNINTKLKCYVSDPLCADHPSLDIANIKPVGAT
uniref:Uncharacterized protein n=1 Tax=Magallana gigas TaxID=29159 RepID=K1QS94_MAGGI